MNGVALKLEKKIPVPRTGKTTGMTDLMQKMAVSESFRLPDGLKAAHPHAYARKLGIKVTVRREGDGYRVWRIA
jgi:hypothetical protein